MEFRVLEYYLTIAREGSISAAAQQLHVSQPSLSRQMKELEDELGKTLFLRGNRQITLTDEGMLLRRRAEEILQLVQKTEREISSYGASVSGDVYIGTAESQVVHILTKAASALRQDYPEIRVHFSSGDGQDVRNQLEKGLLDFALMYDLDKAAKYHSLTMPGTNIWGVLMNKRDSLAAWDEIPASELLNKPLIVSRAFDFVLNNGVELPKENVVATYNLIYSASHMVEDHLGYAICFDGLLSPGIQQNLCFRPIKETPHISAHFLWKKYQVLSPAAELYLSYLRHYL